MEALTARCRTCFDAGVAAADPAVALRKAMGVHPDSLAASGRVIVIAIGKAAAPMMREALAHVAPDAALLVTNYENAVEIEGVTCLAAGHPTPDAAGAVAAAEIIAMLGAVGRGDRVILLLSGGGSALAPAPVAGVSLAEKIAVNDLMLASGAPIDAMNTVRKRLSRLKGGGFARLAAPADVTAFVLSDVPGDDLATVASGPTVANADAEDAARDVLRCYDIWDRAPEPVRAALLAPMDDATAPADTILIGGNAPSVDAMEAAATGPVRRYDGWLDGDVSEAAARIVADMRAAPRPCTLLYGGETTVVVTGGGKGGRNQDLALRVALLLEADPVAGEWAFLSGGTDGRDGPTDAAGGIVTARTPARIRAGGVDPAAALADNDAYAALKAGDALLMTGATGTNVADLQVVVLR